MEKKQTASVEIDLDVFKALTNLSTYVDEPFNDILRRELGVNGQKVSEATGDKAFAIINPKKGIVATGIPVAGGFKVFKSSTICAQVEPSFPDTYRIMRRDLFAKGIINSRLEFTQDYIFSSSSAAASIIFGGSRSGNREWKN